MDQVQTRFLIAEWVKWFFQLIGNILAFIFGGIIGIFINIGRKLR